MNGDQKPQTPEPGLQHKPIDNPPSLSEPSPRRMDIPPPTQERQATVTGQQPTVNVTPSQAAQNLEPGSPASGEGNFYHPDGNSAEAAEFALDNQDSSQAVEWTSSGEELQSQTSAWRIRMTVISVAASAVIYLISRDVVSAGSVAVVGLLFAFLGSRKPPSLNYRLDRTGITIGRKHYAYNEFRAFSVTEDMRSPSINIVPLKRFLPILSIHYDPQQRDKIVEVLADHLPLELRQRDAFDSIINRVRF